MEAKPQIMTTTTDTNVTIKSALISVSDRTGLEELARALNKRDIRLLATGGTAKFLQELDLWVTEVSDYTDFPEIMGGRVKTLHPRIHGGILADRENSRHRAAISNHEMIPIDLLVINLYPFEQSIAEDKDFADAIENIDIGGPSMLRGGAKNHRWVTVLSDPGRYEDFLLHLEENDGATTLEFRRQLAAATFAQTAYYDGIIGRYLQRESYDPRQMPGILIKVIEKSSKLSYGENPHQQAAVYSYDTGKPSLCTSAPLHGKALSFNNLLDANVAVHCVADFDRPAVAIIKHNSPCGVALGENPIEAFHKALACDPLSSFGGVVALNRPLTPEMVEAWGDLFLEAVIAPEVEGSVIPMLSKRKNLRILTVPIEIDHKQQIRSIAGGLLVETPDVKETPRQAMKVVSTARPSEQNWLDMLFAWKVVRRIKSNAVTFARNQATVGIGGGQTSRRYAVEAALAQSLPQGGVQGSVLASDAFFPFPDAVEIAINAGITCVIQPGGSVRDNQVIELIEQHQIVMVHTGFRHFNH